MMNKKTQTTKNVKANYQVAYQKLLQNDDFRWKIGTVQI